MDKTTPALREQATPGEPKLHEIVRKWDLPKFTGYKRTQVEDLIRSGEFPASIKLGARAVGWLVDDLIAWQQARIAASRAGQVAVASPRRRVRQS